jgi:hypothetical protein
MQQPEYVESGFNRSVFGKPYVKVVGGFVKILDLLVRRISQKDATEAGRRPPLYRDAVVNKSHDSLDCCARSGVSKGVV